MTRKTILLILGCIAIAVASLFVGPSLSGPHAQFIFLELRLPRLLVGALAGSALALSGACFQIIFNNPLATPSTVGTLAGATLGALFALTLGLDSELAGLPVTTLAAFVGALGTSFAVAGVASSGRARMSDVLLAGIAVSLAASAIATGVQYAADARALFAAARWSLGQLPQVGYRGVWVLTPFVLVSTVALLSQGRALASFAHPEAIYEANIATMERLGADAWAALQQRCRDQAAGADSG